MSVVPVRLGGSFRDPAGFVFIHDGVLYRQVNRCANESYDRLIDSGLYSDLVQAGWLIPHEEVEGPVADPSVVHRVLRPTRVAFVSHPYEWCFGQLQDAAIRTLDIQLAALDHGMILKDASAYNIQFHRGSAVLIDTLSFEPYVEGSTWDGYRQFCQHFLAPLCLMAKMDVRFGQLSKVFIDGIPLELTSRALGKSTWFSPGILMHIHLHAKAQATYSGTDTANLGGRKAARPLSRAGMLGIIMGLRKLVAKLTWEPRGTEWADYYSATNYSDDALESKLQIVSQFLEEVEPREVWDFGANTGRFSRLAAERNVPTVAFDIDPAAVELNYREIHRRREANLLPLVLDLTNPSSAIGWACSERDSLMDRGPVDCGMALALIHHLAISNNVPLQRIGEFFAALCRHLIVEFVPKSDNQVQRLLRSRKDIFDSYHQSGFERAFAERFEILEKCEVVSSERSLYLLRSRAQT